MIEEDQNLIQDWMIKHGADKLQLDFDKDINHFFPICVEIFSSSGKEILELIFPEVIVHKRKEPSSIEIYGEYYFVINFNDLKEKNDFSKLVEYINQTK